ncbi:uncharacterized protein LOC124155166 [Ischnura elegans]|uniref:uncharacterized protein LOC124155166 n=1 Tax=Ischnura elegans TaxID=197161 RepID=UPI001ED8B504|nr:uncharacterized protein LOC124155166 [Ischnura elegans]
MPSESLEMVELPLLQAPAHNDRRDSSRSSYTMEYADGAPIDEDKMNMLAALIKNDLEEVIQLVDRWEDGPFLAREAFGKDQSPAILIASVNCSKETIDFLISKGATRDCTDLKGRTPILVAAASGNASALSGLLNGGNAHYEFQTGVLVSVSCSTHPSRLEIREDEFMTNVGFQLPLPAVNKRTPLHEAAFINNLDCIESLLKNGAHLHTRDSDGDTALHLAIMGSNDTKETTEAIIDIHYQCIKLLLDKGADLSAKNKKTDETPLSLQREPGETPLDLLLSHDNVYKGVKFLLQYFDTQIKKNEDGIQTGENNTTDKNKRTIGCRTKSNFSLKRKNNEINKRKNNISLNFGSLCPKLDDGGDQVSVILNLMEVLDRQMRRKVFSHPLIRAFVILKWSSIRIFFYIYVSVFILYVISLSVFVTLAYCDIFYIFGYSWHLQVAERGIRISKSVMMATSLLVLINLSGKAYVLRATYRFRLEMYRNLLGVLFTFIVFFGTVETNTGKNIMAETTTVIADSSSPWTKTDDMLSTFSTPQTTRTAVIPGGYAEDLEVHTASYAELAPSWIVNITAMAVFLAWFELMLMVGRFPKWAAQALLFQPVVKNVFQILITYGCLIVGFAFCFFVLFRGSDPDGFGDPWRAFIKTLVMMTGEYDYNDIFGNHTSAETKKQWSRSEMSTVSRLSFLLFIITASIALMNLMLALAVSDTQDLMKTSKESQNTKLARATIQWDYFIERCWTRGCVSPRIKEYLQEKFLLKMQEINDYTKIEGLPFDLYKELKVIASKNAQSAPFRSQDRIKKDALINAIMSLVDDEGKLECNALQKLLSSSRTSFIATMDEVSSRIIANIRAGRQQLRQDHQNTIANDTTPFIDDSDSEELNSYSDEQSFLLTPLANAREPTTSPSQSAVENGGRVRGNLFPPLKRRQADFYKDDQDGFALLQALVEGNAGEVRGWAAWHSSRGSLKTLRYGSDRLTPAIVALSGCSDSNARELLMAGVDPNEADWTGRTPLLVATVNEKSEMMGELLRMGANANSGYKKSQGMRISEAIEDIEWHQKVEQYMDEHNIKPPDIIVEGITPLHLATQKNSLESLKLLFERNAEPNVRDSRGFTPLMLAGEELEATDIDAVKIYENIVKVLLNQDAQMKGIGENLMGITILHRAAQLNAHNALSLLLRKGCDPNWCINQQTPLHIASEVAAKTCTSDPSCISTLISHGADLSAENNGVSALKMIVTEVPRPKKFLLSVLDRQITLKKDSCEYGDEVKVNFKCMSPDNVDSQEKVLHALLNEESISRGMTYEIFRHPVLKSFVNRKWTRLKKFFYAYAVVYLIHVLSLSVFVTLTHSDILQLFGGGWKTSVMQTGIPISRLFVVLTSILVLINVAWMCYVFPHRYPLSFEAFRNVGGSLLCIIVSILTVYDGDTVTFSNRLSEADFQGNPDESELGFTSGETNLLESGLNLDLNYTDEIPIHRNKEEASLNGLNQSHTIQEIVIHCTAIAIFQAWVDLMLLVGRFPWASDALLFTTVLKNVLRVLVTYGYMIIGFAFVFFLEFREVNIYAFGDPWRALLKTMVMMMGEFDYMDTFAGEDKGNAVLVPSNFQIYTQAIFLGFVVIASIALMNLMLGLAVSDTQELADESSQRQLMKLAESVVHWGSAVKALELLCGKNQKVKQWFKGCRTIPSVLQFPMNFKKSTLPRELMKELLEIATKYSNDNKLKVKGSKPIRKTQEIPRRFNSYISKDSTAPKTTDPLSRPPEQSDVMEEIQSLRQEIAELMDMRQDVADIKELLESHFNGEDFQQPLIRTPQSDDSSLPIRTLARILQYTSRRRRGNGLLSRKPNV